MQSKRKTKAQNTLEYVLLLGIIGIALTGMQVYFRRGIQAAIKTAADELGTQKDGLLNDMHKDAEYRSNNAQTTASVAGNKTITLSQGGATSYATDERSQQQGVISYNMYIEKQ